MKEPVKKEKSIFDVKINLTIDKRLDKIERTLPDYITEEVIEQLKKMKIPK
jgi:hypothetical protein